MWCNVKVALLFFALLNAMKNRHKINITPYEEFLNYLTHQDKINNLFFFFSSSFKFIYSLNPFYKGNMRYIENTVWYEAYSTNYTYKKHASFKFVRISYSIAVQYRKKKSFLHIPWEGKLQTFKNTFNKNTKFS